MVVGWVRCEDEEWGEEVCDRSTGVLQDDDSLGGIRRKHSVRAEQMCTYVSRIEFRSKTTKQ